MHVDRKDSWETDLSAFSEVCVGMDSDLDTTLMSSMTVILRKKTFSESFRISLSGKGSMSSKGRKSQGTESKEVGSQPCAQP